MLTANRLIDGDVVYWRAGGWVEAFGEGEVFSAEAEAVAALDAARKSVAANVVVNPYLFEVRAEVDGVRPVTEREIIRAAGPTTRTDLGKQARHVSL
jgi:sulfite reductase (NADPH) hemoprotein beta-component